MKSHVAADWISACMSTGAALARTDGTEQRQVYVCGGCARSACATFVYPPQFLHVEDVVAALEAMMVHHAQLQVRVCRCKLQRV